MSKKPPTLAKRDNWGTRIGFLMTTWFAAIGIGNMWRFPFRCAENGGGAWEANEEYTWSWWLARSEGGKWKLMTWGY